VTKVRLAVVMRKVDGAMITALLESVPPE